jgi:hypothetical protein
MKLITDDWKAVEVDADPTSHGEFSILAYLPDNIRDIVSVLVANDKTWESAMTR